jgi:hypothetical protein
MSRAYVTLVTNDLYVAGGIVVACSLRLTRTRYPLICVITRQVTSHSREVLATIFDSLVEVEPIDSQDEPVWRFSGVLSSG